MPKAQKEDDIFVQGNPHRGSGQTGIPDCKAGLGATSAISLGHPTGNFQS